MGESQSFCVHYSKHDMPFGCVASRSTEATVSEEFDILPFQLYRGFLPFGSVESARW